MRVANNIYIEQYKFLNYITTGVFIINKDYEVLLWNNNIESWTKIKDSEILGKKLTDFFPNFSQPLYLKLLNDVFEHGMTTIFSSKLHPDLFSTGFSSGQKMHTTVLPTPDIGNKGYNALFSIENQTTLTDLITKNRGLNNLLQTINEDLEIKIQNRTLELEKTNLRLSSILNSAPLSIILLNSQLEIIEINNEGIEFFEGEVSASGNQKICDYINCVNESCRNIPSNVELSANCKIGNLISNTLKNGEKYHKVECSITRKTKENKVVTNALLVSTTKISSDGDSHLLLIMDDITQRKQIETELIKAKNQAIESDNLKSAFLANMSHEIRTPLNAIVGFSDLIARLDVEKAEREMYSRLILESSDQLLSQINSIIDISKLESNQLQTYYHDFDMNEIMDDIYNSVVDEKSNKNLTINLQKGQPNKPCIVSTDKVRLTQIMNNLINNAIKFTSKGSVEFGYIPETDNIKFFVKDTGVGIPGHMHEIIFKPFRQAREETMEIYRGSGLGLAISHGLVEILGGKIWLESEINKGSTFYFTIPLIKNI